MYVLCVLDKEDNVTTYKESIDYKHLARGQIIEIDNKKYIFISTELIVENIPFINVIGDYCYDALDIASKVFNVSIEKIISQSKEELISIARHLFVYLLRVYSGLILSDIGYIINRHHATIIYSRQKIEDLLFIKDSKYESLIKKGINLYKSTNVLYKFKRKLNYITVKNRK